jgi:hypothetical protein
MNSQPNKENQYTDYATLWNSLQLARAGINDSLKCMAGEYLLGVDTEDDFTLLQRLEAVQGVINSCVELVSLKSGDNHD